MPQDLVLSFAINKSSFYDMEKLSISNGLLSMFAKKKAEYVGEKGLLIIC